MYTVKFNQKMANETIGQSDCVINIDSSYNLDYTWSASYTSDDVLTFTIKVKTVLVGTETLRISLNNYKKFRTDVGG